MEVNEEEFFLKFKRQVFNSGRSDKRRRGFEADDFKLRFPTNQWDVDGTCPDSVAAEAWDYPFGNVTIENRVVIVDRSIDTGVVRVLTGGKLIFKDRGPTGNLIKFRALAWARQRGADLGSPPRPAPLHFHGVCPRPAPFSPLLFCVSFLAHFLLIFGAF